MDQTGDPTDTGRGGSTKPDLPGEFTFRRDSQTPLVVVARNNGLEEGFTGSQPVISQTLDLALRICRQQSERLGYVLLGGSGHGARSEAL